MRRCIICRKSSNIDARTPEAVGSNMRGPAYVPRRDASSRETFIVRCSYSLALVKKTPVYMHTESKLHSCITCVPLCICTFGFGFLRLTMAHHRNCGSHLVRIRLQVHWNYELDLGFDTGNHYECLSIFTSPNIGLCCNRSSAVNAESTGTKQSSGGLKFCLLQRQQSVPECFKIAKQFNLKGE